VTRHLLHSEEGPGRIRRVTAAVVVNDRMTTEGSGKVAHPVWKQRGPEEMQQLEQLARAAVGFDATRGDQVVIENVSFSSNTPEAGPVGMAKVMDGANSLLEAQPGLVKTLCFAVLGLVLVMTVIKPVSRQMVTALSQTASPKTPSQNADQPAGIAGRGTGIRSFGQPGNPALANFAARTRPTDAQEVYEQISEQIRREPAQSTRLLESWINAPVEEDE
jgi:flagellar M-ring protein FliF